MKKPLILSALLVGLTGCSDEATTEAALTTVLTNALLNGTWFKCEIESAGPNPGTTSFSVTVVLNDGVGTSDVTNYANLTCSGPGNASPQEIITYTLGVEVPVDGTVAGITTATEMDLSFNGATADLSVVAVENLTMMYAGGNGTTTTRATTLDPIPFILQ